MAATATATVDREVDRSAPEIGRLTPEPSGRSLGWWGTVALIATEGMIFALLLFGNFFLRAQADQWPLGDIKDPELFKSGIRTAILLASSIPAQLAHHASQRGDTRRMLVNLAIAWVMAAVFVAGHVEETLILWEEFEPSTNAYGSVFYTITSLHIVHLLVGMLLFAYVFVQGSAGRYRNRPEPVENSVLYWHFVDVVWVFVYSSLYLSVTWL